LETCRPLLLAVWTGAAAISGVATFNAATFSAAIFSAFPAAAQVAGEDVSWSVRPSAAVTALPVSDPPSAVSVHGHDAPASGNTRPDSKRIGVQAPVPRRASIGKQPAPHALAKGATHVVGTLRRAATPLNRARRYVTKEVLVALPSTLSPQAIDDIARRHRLTRLETLSVGLTGTTFHRWRIWDRRSVSDVIRALEAEAGPGIAQPNYRYSLQ
jgi:hypothetical protein